MYVHSISGHGRWDLVAGTARMEVKRLRKPKSASVTCMMVAEARISFGRFRWLLYEAKRLGAKARET